MIFGVIYFLQNDSMVYLCSKRPIMKPTTLFTLCCLLLFSCKGNRFEVPGSSEHPIKLVRFDQQFHTNDPSLDSAFLKLYAVNIMEMGEPGGEDFKAFSDIYARI